jgi:serine/threonine protein phosphatase 1
LIFLGDYVDRGPDSAGVMDRVCTRLDRHPGTVALKGNHEDLMLRFLRSGDLRACSLWLMNGGEATLASYDLDPPADPMDPAEAAACRARLEKALPEAHRRLLETAPALSRQGDYVFVHAGLRPGVPLEDQREEELIWIREPFLTSAADFGFRVVHGHTPTVAPDLHDNRIGLDTGAGKGGYLTAGLFWDTEIAFLHAYP